MVTQWKSLTSSACGSARNSSQREREGVLDEAANLELPFAERHVGLLAEVEHRPVLHFVLADRQLRHAVAVRRALALGPMASEADVDVSVVERNLALDVLQSPFDEIRFVRHG